MQVRAAWMYKILKFKLWWIGKTDLAADTFRNSFLTYHTFEREDFFFMSLYNFFLFFHKVFPVFFDINRQKKRVFYLIEELLFRQSFPKSYIVTGLIFGIITNFHNLKWRVFFNLGSVMTEQPDMVVNLSPQKYVFKEAYLKQIPSFGVTMTDSSLATYSLFGSMFNTDLQYVYLTFFFTFRRLLKYIGF